MAEKGSAIEVEDAAEAVGTVVLTLGIVEEPVVGVFVLPGGVVVGGAELPAEPHPANASIDMMHNAPNPAAPAVRPLSSRMIVTVGEP